MARAPPGRVIISLERAPLGFMARLHCFVRSARRIMPCSRAVSALVGWAYPISSAPAHWADRAAVAGNVLLECGGLCVGLTLTVPRLGSVPCQGAN